MPATTYFPVYGLDPVQLRVLGCLLEKQQAAPDA
jgi:hypothetical protein